MLDFLGGMSTKGRRLPVDRWKEAIGRGLEIYQPAMRNFIRATLQVEYGESWFSAQVGPRLYGKDWRLERSRKSMFTRGESPDVQIDVGEFAKVIKEFDELFPEPIRRGHHHQQLNKITEIRNIHVHGTRKLHKADAKEVLGACREVLNLCGCGEADDIEDIIHSLSSPSRRDGPSRKIRLIDLTSSRLRAGFVVGLLLGGLVVIAFLALQRDDSAVGSTQEQAVTAATTQVTTGTQDDSSGAQGSGSGVSYHRTDQPTPTSSEATTAQATAGSVNRSVVQGRIVMRVADRTGTSGEDHWSVEFGFLPEWAMDRVDLITAIETWSDLLPVRRYLSSDLIERRAADNNRRWLSSSPISVPTQPAEASDRDVSEIAGRVVARYNPDSRGHLRIEFGFLPDRTDVNTGAAQDANTRDSDILLPQHRFISESVISHRRGSWLRSSVIEVPTADLGSGRIVARRLADGRTEFGWQPTDGGERVLPRQRYFPTDARVGHWLRSSVIEVDGIELGQIEMRLQADGRIEFAFTPSDGERILPLSRHVPVDAGVGRWLMSTVIELGE